MQVKGEPFSAEKFKSHLLVKSHVRFTAPQGLEEGFTVFSDILWGEFSLRNLFSYSLLLLLLLSISWFSISIYMC